MPTWLIKSEPEAYSFDQLVKDSQTAWTGVRNYTARNNLRAMKTGELALFYHSNVGKAVVGIAKVVREAYSEALPAGEKGDWSAVDFAPVRAFRTPVTLEAMRVHPILKKMEMFRLGRLSVSPVTQPEFEAVLLLGAADGPPATASAAPAKKKAAPKKTAAKKAAAKKAPKKAAKKAPAKKKAPKKR